MTLVDRLRAEIDCDVNEPLDLLLDEAADRIEHLELALVELTLTSGSSRSVSSTELLASRVRTAARRALEGRGLASRQTEPSPDKINKAFKQAIGC